MKPTELYNAVTDAVAQAPTGLRAVINVYGSHDGRRMDLMGYPDLLGSPHYSPSGVGRESDLVLRLTPLTPNASTNYVPAKSVMYLSVFYVEEKKL